MAVPPGAGYMKNRLGIAIRNSPLCPAQKKAKLVIQLRQ